MRSPLLAALLLLSGAPSDYRASVEGFRRAREVKVAGPNGWMCLSGLVFLKPGVNRLGSAPGSDVRLPGGAPAEVGELDLEGESVRLAVRPGVSVLREGAPIEGGPVAPEVERYDVGTAAFQLIERGGRDAIRVWDNACPARLGFAGLEWYPIHESYRVLGTFHAYPESRSVPIVSILGYTSDFPSPGYVTFTLGGRELRLEPVLEEKDAKELFFLFRDETAGKTTYPAGRFLYTPLPKDGTVVLDFNEAFSPPCAFTAYATCPIPPKQNRLGLPIEAGERGLGHH
jgi:uncharacterized protein (DUF1684 family)